MNTRSMLGSLQVPIAAVGGLLLVVSIGGIVTMPSPPPESEGFVAGLALIFLYFLGWVGFVVFSLGLAIPPGEGYGITFTRYQRGLFVVGGITGFLSAIGPFVAFGILLSNPALMTTTWLALMVVAVLALGVGLGWRGVQAVQRWRLDREGVTSGR